MEQVPIFTIKRVGLSTTGHDIRGKYRGTNPDKPQLFEYSSDTGITGEIWEKSLQRAKRELRKRYPEGEI